VGIIDGWFDTDLDKADAQGRNDVGETPEQSQPAVPRMSCGHPLVSILLTMPDAGKPLRLCGTRSHASPGIREQGNNEASEIDQDTGGHRCPAKPAHVCMTGKYCEALWQCLRFSNTLYMLRTMVTPLIVAHPMVRACATFLSCGPPG
jgi:hypothetical protein